MKNKHITNDEYLQYYNKTQATYYNAISFFCSFGNEQS